MKYLIIFFVFFSSFAQDDISSSFFNNATVFVGVDNTNHIYFIKNNTLHKKFKSKLNTYANLHLGNITSVDITNPLKIVVFYADFNSVVILDNELNELTGTIDFTPLLNKNISFVGSATNTNLWLFCNDDNSLQIWDYNTKKTPISIPIVNDFICNFTCSNYRNFWLITNDFVLHFNDYGSFVEQLEIKNIKKCIAYNDGFIFLTNKQLIYYHKKSFKVLLSVNNDIFIDSKNTSLYIANDKVYFFDGISINMINL